MDYITTLAARFNAEEQVIRAALMDIGLPPAPAEYAVAPPPLPSLPPPMLPSPADGETVGDYVQRCQSEVDKILALRKQHAEIVARHVAEKAAYERYKDHCFALEDYEAIIANFMPEAIRRVQQSSGDGGLFDISKDERFDDTDQNSSPPKLSRSGKSVSGHVAVHADNLELLPANVEAMEETIGPPSCPYVPREFGT